jgi:hypothetical protein
VRAIAAGLFAVLIVVVVPREARADDEAVTLPPIVVRSAALGIGAIGALSGVGRAPPTSLVAVAWPSSYYRGVSEAWSVPDGGRKPMLYVTLVDLRF